jgi:hypothetical protein
MANNDRFRANINKRIERAKGKFELFVKKLLVDIDASLVLKSPVDTGRFRANWVLGNGGVNPMTKDSFEAANNAPIINSVKVNGQTIYITNSLPYANRLEYGYSQQAPAGMVRITLAEVNSMASKIGVELRALR